MRKHYRLLLVILACLLGLVFCYPLILGGAAGFLQARDRLEKADVIIVLAGDDNGERVVEGVKLFQAGYAPRLLMSGGPLAWQLTYAGRMKEQALAAGVPAAAIILQDRSRSTIEDARFCLPLVKEHGWRSVLLVTSPYHARRAGLVFKKLFSPAGVRVSVRGCAVSIFNPDRWWTRHEDVSLVAWEYMGLVMYLLKGHLI